MLGGQIISTTDADADTLFNQLMREFEQQHPDITIEELLDTNTQLPEDTKVVNKVKNNLVTIERTSGCLSYHEYSWSIPFAFSVR